MQNCKPFQYTWQKQTLKDKVETIPQGVGGWSLTLPKDRNPRRVSLQQRVGVATSFLARDSRPLQGQDYGGFLYSFLTPLFSKLSTIDVHYFKNKAIFFRSLNKGYQNHSHFSRKMQNRSSVGRQTRFITLSVKGAPVQGSRGRGLSLLLLAMAHAPWPAAAPWFTRSTPPPPLPATKLCRVHSPTTEHRDTTRLPRFNAQRVHLDTASAVNTHEEK